MMIFNQYFTKTIVFLSLLLGVCSGSNALVYKGKCYSNIEDPTCKLYCLYDKHQTLSIKKMLDQRSALVAGAKQKIQSSSSNTTLPFFINEDFFAGQTSTPALAQFIEQVKKDNADIISKKSSSSKKRVYDLTMLLGLTQHMQQEGFHACNVDFRLATCALLSGHNVTITKEMLAQEYQNQLNRVQQFNDSEAFNEYYADVVKEMQEDELYIALQDNTTDLETLTQMLGIEESFGQGLINAQALHELYQQRGRKTIIMCFGGEHLEEMEPLIEEHYNFAFQNGYDIEEVAKMVLANIPDIEDELDDEGDAEGDEDKASAHERFETELVNCAVADTAMDIKAFFECTIPDGASSSNSNSSSSSSDSDNSREEHKDNAKKSSDTEKSTANDGDSENDYSEGAEEGDVENEGDDDVQMKLPKYSGKKRDASTNEVAQNNDLYQSSQQSKKQRLKK